MPITIARTWPWLRGLLGLGILAALAWTLGTETFADGLRVVDLAAILAALGIGLFTTVLSACRWRLVAGQVGLPLPFGPAVAEYYRALFLNAVLPGGVLGDVDRAVRHGKEVADVGRSARAVVLERAAGQVVLLGIAATVLLGRPSFLVALLDHVVTTLGVVVVGAALVALAVAVAVTVRARRGLTGLRWRKALATAQGDLRHGLLGRTTWPWLVLLSAAIVAGHLALFVVAARSAGSTAPTAELLPLMLLALLAMALPLSVGGWGPREGVATFAFGAAGLGMAQGLTVAVTYGVLAFVASLPGAVVLLIPRNSGVRAVRG